MKLFASTLAALLAMTAVAQNPVDYVSTLQGTAQGHGNSFPDTTMPRGVHSWSPRTCRAGEGEKYRWDKDTIFAFDLTHQCNTWLIDYGVLSLMPESGKLCLEEEKRGASFKHSKETCKPHYYSVTFDNGITTEIAPTERCAALRFTYPQKQDAYLVIDGGIDESSVVIDPEHRQVSGYVRNMPWYIGEDNPSKKLMKTFFIMQFDKAFEDWGIWENRIGTISPGYKEADGKRFGAYLKFAKGAKVSVKIAASFISPQQAEINYDKEIASDRNLEETRDKGASVWNELLGRMKVRGGSEEDKRTFYTCLYRANLFPRMSYDWGLNGRPHYFSPYDGKIHDGYMFTDCGLWDAYHSQMPLYCLTDFIRQGQYVSSMISTWEEWGWLPSWSCPGESGMMIGNHAISVLADAWAKGIRTFDPHTALKAYLHEATHKSTRLESCGRPDWEDYFTLGYIADREGVGCSTAKTLEYAYDDWCAWMLAEETGDKLMATIFGKQMGNWRNVFDASSRFMRGRLPDGSWLEPFDPFLWDGYFSFESRSFCEGNAWHYTWSVQQDIRGLRDAMGGKERFCQKLDSLFTMPYVKARGRWADMDVQMPKNINQMGQYAHGNEPVHHVAYLYNYAGQPWKSQRYVREIMARQYSYKPDGFPGDEDQGAMSAWYVLSAAGLYCVTPGSGEYVLGSPLFPQLTISLSNGKTFTINASGNNDINVYIQSATLNGKSLDRNYITHEEIMAGGTLDFVMGPEPNLSRGTSTNAEPYSLSSK